MCLGETCPKAWLRTDVTTRLSALSLHQFTPSFCPPASFPPLFPKATHPRIPWTIYRHATPRRTCSLGDAGRRARFVRQGHDHWALDLPGLDCRTSQQKAQAQCCCRYVAHSLVAIARHGPRHLDAVARFDRVCCFPCCDLWLPMSICWTQID